MKKFANVRPHNATPDTLQSPGRQQAGRFAPSPTGDLHFGSLLAAVASYCEARSKGAQWFLRIDDIDGPRSVVGSPVAIQQSLRRYGFQWDGDTHWQSARDLRYQNALAQLIECGLVFSCNCSRRKLPPGQPYPGTCRQHRVHSLDEPIEDRALRLIAPANIVFSDGIQGRQHIDLSDTCGDFIIWRRDKLVSYTLACAVDDAMDCTEVVRGADLLGSTSAQLAIMHYLALSPPRYAHLPVAIDANDDKLSKHSKATAIDSLDVVTSLQRAWHFLGQTTIDARSVDEFWQLAISHWQLGCVPAALRLREPDLA